MALQGPQPQPKSSTCGLDFLYCHEETWVDLRLNKFEEEEEEEPATSSSSSFASSHDDENIDDDQRLVDLISKEQTELTSLDITPLMMADSSRKEAVKWMMMVNAYYGFSTLTVVLAVNYFDRFMLVSSKAELFHKIPSLNSQSMPWAIQLVSVACLSLASKVQETQVHLPLDFQIDCKYVFNAKTIRRMELLVLSTLEWKMNPVTPFSYFEHLTKKLRWKTHLQWEILQRTESLILSILADPRYLCYPSSAVTAAIVVQAMTELEHLSATESEILLMDALRISKDKVAECCKFISELSSNNQPHKKRRICSSLGGGISSREKETEEGICHWRICYSGVMETLPESPPENARKPAESRRS